MGLKYCEKSQKNRKDGDDLEKRGRSSKVMIRYDVIGGDVREMVLFSDLTSLQSDGDVLCQQKGRAATWKRFLSARWAPYEL